MLAACRLATRTIATTVNAAVRRINKTFPFNRCSLRLGRRRPVLGGIGSVNVSTLRRLLRRLCRFLLGGLCIGHRLAFVYYLYPSAEFLVVRVSNRHSH